MTRRAFSSSVFAMCGDEILLIHHKLLNLWLPVGGELEVKMIIDGKEPVLETPFEAAKRELLEETGLVGDFVPLSEIAGEPPGFLGYEEHTAGPKGMHLNFVFLCFVGTREVIGDGSFHTHRWIRPGDVESLKGTTLNVRQFAQRIEWYASLGRPSAR
jgi:ADP-ribose pyrophosphatase YjhB (NUDIX family)